MAAPLQYSFLLLPFLCLFLALAFSSGEADPKVPAIFIFGDSSADVGNNKYLPGNKNSDYNFLPYGIDYPTTNGRHATGRFSNGYNGADVLAQEMGFNESPPPYLSLRIDNNKINIAQAKNGINFASGGSRIVMESSETIISLAEQIEYFREYRLQLYETMASDQIDQLFSKSLFLISIGGNDIGVYLIRALNNTDQIDFLSFISNLTTTYGNQLKDLYKLGGKKFGIVNVAPAGYIPGVRNLCKFDSLCINIVNAASWVFNYALEDLMNNLSSTLPGMKYSIGNSYAVFKKIIDNPGAFGFKNVTHPCCGSVIDGCNVTSTICSDRRQYSFWDGVHPTQATGEVFGHLVYNGPTEYASPINFKELAEDDNDLISVY